MHKICRKYRKKLAIVTDCIIIVHRPEKNGADDFILWRKEDKFMKKKVVSLMLCACVALAAAGCGSGKFNNPDKGEALIMATNASALTWRLHRRWQTSWV